MDTSTTTPAAPVAETKVYSDGTEVTGPGPLPDQSPAQQDASAAPPAPPAAPKPVDVIKSAILASIPEAEGLAAHILDRIATQFHLTILGEIAHGAAIAAQVAEKNDIIKNISGK